VLLLVIAMVMACGGGIMPRLPSRGGAPWIELRSEHFRLWTNASVARAHELIISLEERRQVIARAMNRTQQAAKIFVIAMRNKEELAAFLPPPVMAFAWREQNPTHQAGIAIPAVSDDSEVIMNHEVAHAISYALIADQPRWFAEGLASYFEMATLDPKTRVAEIGVPRAGLLQVLQWRGPISARKLFACKGGGCIDVDFYASSWALFSYLLNEHFARFGAYLQHLQQPDGDHAKAWSAAFPGLQLERLDDQLWEWVQSGKFAVPRISVVVRRYPAVERPLGDADVLAAWSLLSYFYGRSATSLANAEAALALDRTHVLAWAMKTAQGETPSVPASRAIVEAHPEDWRAWQLLYFALLPTRGAEEELKAVRTRLCAMAAKEGEHCPPGSEKPPTKLPAPAGG
jgi:hypothetical protein